MKNCPRCDSDSIDLKIGMGEDGVAHCYAIECCDCKFKVRAYYTPDNRILWAEDIWEALSKRESEDG